MKQTDQYKLNQWELSDRIRMEDFNADNVKIAAALTGKQNKWELVRTTNAGLSDIFGLPGDWKAYESVAALFIPRFTTLDKSETITWTLMGGDPLKILKETAQTTDPSPVLYLFSPMGDGERPARGLFIGGGFVRIISLEMPIKLLRSYYIDRYNLINSKITGTDVYIYGIKT